MFGPLILAASLAQAVPPAAPVDDTFFELKIRPVLAETCFKCHGGAKTSRGLVVDRREALLRGGTGGPAVVPGDTEKSLLIRAIRHVSEDLQMPPGRKLPDASVADFTAWVAGGAQWPQGAGPVLFRTGMHWA